MRSDVDRGDHVALSVAHSASRILFSIDFDDQEAVTVDATTGVGRQPDRRVELLKDGWALHRVADRKITALQDRRIRDAQHPSPADSVGHEFTLGVGLGETKLHVVSGLNPGCAHNRSERERSGASRVSTSSGPNSKNVDSTAYWNGMSSPSIQAIGRSVRLWSYVR